MFVAPFLPRGIAKESPRYLRILKEHPHKSPHSVAENGVLPGCCRVYLFETFGSSGRIRTYNPSVNRRPIGLFRRCYGLLQDAIYQSVTGFSISVV
jgi:hypothetical protein